WSLSFRRSPQALDTLPNVSRPRRSEQDFGVSPSPHQKAGNSGRRSFSGIDSIDLGTAARESAAGVDHRSRIFVAPARQEKRATTIAPARASRKMRLPRSPQLEPG